jgi:hypothetical protein
MRQTNSMANTGTRPYTSGLLPGGYMKDTVHILPLSTTLHQLRARITDAIAQVVTDMFRQIWDEIAYRWDIC